jgi:hypothetical protein
MYPEYIPKRNKKKMMMMMMKVLPEEKAGAKQGEAQ